tara:strand:+ start:9 stop:1052 length:1044 start_codon:yes stop_codon:yes gene_type:complete
MHQTQYYNGNFKDKDPNFNPRVSRITLFKDPEGEDTNLGMILVKTGEYVQDLNVLPGLGKRVSEVVNEGDSNITSFLLKYRDASVKHIEGRLEDDMGTQEVAIEYLDWSEEEASDADGTVYADAAETIADNPELAQEFLDQDDMKQIKMASGVNETSCKVGDTLTKDGRRGKVIKHSKTQATVDFGNGDVYGIAHSRIKDGKILKEATRQDLGMSSSVSKRRAKAELKKPGNDGSKVYGLDKDGKRVHIKSINDVDKFKKFELDADLNENKVADKDIEKEIKSLQKENPKGYAAEIKKLKVRLAAINLSKKKVIKEEATCCGKCGREHVKGNCKRPYLKGAKHCRTK